MRVEFLGTYKKHEIKKTKTDKEYVQLICYEQFSKKNVKICIFNNKCIENLEAFKDGDDISVIFETWYSKKANNNVLLVKDIVAC